MCRLKKGQWASCIKVLQHVLALLANVHLYPTQVDEHSTLMVFQARDWSAPSPPKMDSSVATFGFNSEAHANHSPHKDGVSVEKNRLGVGSFWSPCSHCSPPSPASIPGRRGSWSHKNTGTGHCKRHIKSGENKVRTL